MGLFKSSKKNQNTGAGSIEQMKDLANRVSIKLDEIIDEDYVLETFSEKPKSLTIREAVKFDKEQQIKKAKNEKIIARAEFNQIDKMFQEIECKSVDSEILKLAKDIHKKSLKNVKKTENNYLIAKHNVGDSFDFEWSKSEKKYVPIQKTESNKMKIATDKIDSSTKTLKKVNKKLNKVSKKTISRKTRFH